MNINAQPTAANNSKITNEPASHALPLLAGVSGTALVESPTLDLDNEQLLHQTGKSTTLGVPLSWEASKLPEPNLVQVLLCRSNTAWTRWTYARIFLSTCFCAAIYTNWDTLVSRILTLCLATEPKAKKILDDNDGKERSNWAKLRYMAAFMALLFTGKLLSACSRGRRNAPTSQQLAEELNRQQQQTPTETQWQEFFTHPDTSPTTYVNANGEVIQFDDGPVQEGAEYYNMGVSTNRYMLAQGKKPQGIKVSKKYQPYANAAWILFCDPRVRGNFEGLGHFSDDHVFPEFDAPVYGCCRQKNKCVCPEDEEDPVKEDTVGCCSRTKRGKIIRSEGFGTRFYGNLPEILRIMMDGNKKLTDQDIIPFAQSRAGLLLKAYTEKDDPIQDDPIQTSSDWEQWRIDKWNSLWSPILTENRLYEASYGWRFTYEEAITCSIINWLRSKGHIMKDFGLSTRREYVKPFNVLDMTPKKLTLCDTACVTSSLPSCCMSRVVFGNWSEKYDKMVIHMLPDHGLTDVAPTLRDDQSEGPADAGPGELSLETLIINEDSANEEWYSSKRTTVVRTGQNMWRAFSDSGDYVDLNDEDLSVEIREKEHWCYYYRRTLITQANAKIHLDNTHKRERKGPDWRNRNGFYGPWKARSDSDEVRRPLAAAED